MKLELEEIIDPDGRQGFALRTLDADGNEIVTGGHIDHAALVIDWHDGPRDAARVLTGVLLEAARSERGGKWYP